MNLNPLNPTPPPHHIPRLDVLRAVAILAVLGLHFVTYGMKIHAPGNGNDLFVDYSYWPLHDFYLLTPLTLGGIGVGLFFLLSGFCIHYSFLQRPASFSTVDFYWRRFLRIYPAYLVAMTAFILLAWNFHYEPFGPVTSTQIISHLFLIHDLSRNTIYGISGAFWSLAVEFQFYLIYPLLLMGRRRFKLQGCFIGALAINVICQIAVCLSKPDVTNIHGFLWSLPFTSWWSWILGACVAEAYVTGNSVFERRTLIAFLSFILWIFACVFRPLEGNNALFGCVFCGVVMEAYLAWPKPLMRVERLLIPVGLFSYSLYLWHHPLMYPLYRVASRVFGFKSPSVAEVIVYLPLTLLLLLPLAAASYYWIELGVPRLIRHLISKRWRSLEPKTEMTAHN
jgi:peptidoglycan/LPS O-acetylase OafA/YrhL